MYNDPISFIDPTGEVVVSAFFVELGYKGIAALAAIVTTTFIQPAIKQMRKKIIASKPSLGNKVPAVQSKKQIISGVPTYSPGPNEMALKESYDAQQKTFVESMNPPICPVPQEAIPLPPPPAALPTPGPEAIIRADEFLSNPETGYFGKKGEGGKSTNSRVRNLEGGNEAAKRFFEEKTKGYVKERALPNDKGIARDLPDGTTITYRPTSTSDGTPTVQITGSGSFKPQKIHFTP